MIPEASRRKSTLSFSLAAEPHCPRFDCERRLSMPRSTSWWWLVAGLPGPYMHPPLAGALDVSTGNRAGEPPPQRTGSGAAGMSNLARQAAPLDAHAADLQHLAFGPPHSHAPQTHASDNAASSGAREGVPPARMHATLTAVGDGRLFLFGGTAARRQPGGSRYLNDLFVFDSAKRGAWSAEQLARPACCDDNALVDALGPRPAPRTQHAAAWDGHSSRVFVFGGMTDQVGFNGEAASRKQYSGYSTTTRGGEAGGRAEAQADEGFMDPSASSQDRDNPSSPVYLNDLHYFDTAADALWQGTPPGESGGTTQRGAGGDLSASSGRAMRWSGKLTVRASQRFGHTMKHLLSSLLYFRELRLKRARADHSRVPEPSRSPPQKKYVYIIKNKKYNFGCTGTGERAASESPSVARHGETGPLPRRLGKLRG